MPLVRRESYVARSHERALALSYYLYHERSLGHEEAAARTCGHFGHDRIRGGVRCERCAAPLLGEGSTPIAG